MWAPAVPCTCDLKAVSRAMAMHLGRLTRTAALGCFLSAALATHNVRGTGECVRPGRCEVCTRGATC